MFKVDELSRLDWTVLKNLPTSEIFWEFFDVAPYDAPCCDPSCLGDHPIPWLFSWGEYIVFACSAVCVCGGVRFYLRRREAEAAEVLPARSIMSVGVYGSRVSKRV